MENNIINNNIEYTVDYFIKKFDSIPTNKWCTGTFIKWDGTTVTCCAYGHCGVRASGHSDEGRALQSLFQRIKHHAVSVNDGIVLRYRQSTPKERILAALYDIKGIIENENKKSRVEEGSEILGQVKEEVIVNSIINEKVLEEVL